MKKKRKSTEAEPWKAAKKKYRLTESQIYMAKALGLNPRKFGGYANHKQQPWKAPLPDYIEELYEKRFKKEVPAEIRAKDKNAEKQRATKNKKADFLDFNEASDCSDFNDFSGDDLPF